PSASAGDEPVEKRRDRISPAAPRAKIGTRERGARDPGPPPIEPAKRPLPTVVGIAHPARQAEDRRTGVEVPREEIVVQQARRVAVLVAGPPTPVRAAAGIDTARSV